eukprot:gene2757-3538_t
MQTQECTVLDTAYTSIFVQFCVPELYFDEGPEMYRGYLQYKQRQQFSMVRALYKVEKDRASPYFLGAEVGSNNTGELSAIGEAFLWILENDRTPTPVVIRRLSEPHAGGDPEIVVIRYDSKYAANISNRTFKAHKNQELASTVQGTAHSPAK